MATITDPAKDLADICAALTTSTGQSGDIHLAQKFGVQAWSREFFQIIFTIHDRAKFVSDAVKELVEDQEVVNDAVSNISNVMNAFGKDSMTNAWSARGVTFLQPGNLSAIRGLSGTIRPKYSYPNLTSEELAEIITMISELKEWMKGHQLTEKDFIRQLIIDGIENLEFRVQHMKWLGWGYAIESLREIIGAYFALERGIIDPNKNPLEQAILQKLATFVKGFYEKAKFAKDVMTTADFMIRMYGAASLTVKAAQAAPGLLTFMSH